MAQAVKGTVTSLASMFPVEEAEKAAQLVHDSISDRQIQLEHLNRFITENTDLVNLVHRLPDELSHQIMVPFGKAAFFPGRLIHTNEFTVLLGDGYYAERTSKQTTEILQRRGKVLESQVDSLKATILDLQAEASFFNATAAEAAEGLIEIREDYIEEHPTERKPKSGLSKSNSLGSCEENEVKVATEYDEYARVMSRLDELEKEEFEAQSHSEDDKDARLDSSLSQNFIYDHGVEKSGKHRLKDPIQKLKGGKLFSTTAGKSSSGNYSQQDHADLSTINNPDSLSEDLKLQDMAKDESLHGKNLVHRMDKSNTGEKRLLVSESAGRVDRVSTPKYEAFTGSIVEHRRSIPSNIIGQNLASSQVPASTPSKPVSRFKMQKSGRNPGH